MTAGRTIAVLTCMWTGCADDGPGAAPTPASPEVSEERDAPVRDRLVVIHIPGVDPDLVERWRVDLPTLDRLSGGQPLTRLDFDPPGTWRVVGEQAATGRRAGAAGPLGGAELDPATGQVVPARLAEWARGAPAWWEIAARAGVSTRSMWMPGPLPPADTPDLQAIPAAVPAEQPFGAIAIAVGGAAPPNAPDLGFSTAVEGEGPWTVEVPLTAEATWGLELQPLGEDAWRLTIEGVRTDLALGEISAPFAVRLPDAIGGGDVVVRAAATERAGGALITVLEPGVGPGGDAPLTVPPDLHDQWRRRHGPLDTSGGAAAVQRAFSAGLVGPAQLVAVAREELEERGEILVAELQRADARLVVADLPEAGLVTQALFGFSDPQHPAWSPQLAAGYGPAPKALLVALDEVLGRVRRTLQEGDRLLVISDHGVHSAHALVDLNAWLAAQGRIDGGPKAGQPPALLGLDLPWDRVRAWSVGPGYVYVGARGRAGGGAAADKRRDADIAALRRALTAWRNGDDRVVADVRTGDEVFPSRPAEERPDLVVRFAEGTDVSPVSFHGGVGARPVVPNAVGLTGGIGASAADLRGFAVSSFGLIPEGARVVDLGPTVLSLLSVDTTVPMDGRAWDISFQRPVALPPAP